ncbi:peroxiredoxin [Halobacillus shinanisalinarum]|uniref:Peroxiredoxin n=1 Tax=Halobacillus shinanisalinarum TaxID=2932258 RepID=A0ABY4GWT3_9BACI|nr:peroxiredoxin [Halobacillus shinanisalinarum]UOQ92588.1 peroxiredoxin [Halobacillus shinanisalinarum]
MEQEQTQSVSLPRIGEKAPDFTANTTQGEISLDSYKGKWFVLFSHPADFTPVCTTEFVGFQGIYDQLQELDTELLGLSIDSISSHIAWIRNIEENFNTKIKFPVIADLNKYVAMKFGMIMPESGGTETSRAVFVIDDKGTVRSVIYYPLSTGRNMAEIVRLVEALKTTDEHGVSTPADWTKGDQVIAPPPKTQEAADKRANDPNYDCVDWYFCKKDLDQ